MIFIVNSLTNSLFSIAVLALATMGITLIFKTSYTTNFAQGSISVIGGYVAALLCAKSGFSVWAALPIAMAASFVFAGLVDFVLFQHGRGVNALGKQIITMGLVLLITGAIPMIVGSAEIIVNMTFLQKIWTFSTANGDIVLSANSLFCFGITVLIIGVIFALLKYSKWGISVRATAANEQVAQLMGINTRFVTTFTWGIAGALGALSAIMLLSINQITVGYMVGTQVDAFMAGILGGLNTFAGPIVGAVLIPIIRYILKYQISMWADVCLYAIILFVVLLRPTGLLGKKTIIKV